MHAYDTAHMKHCLTLAQRAIEKKLPPFGCVIANGDNIVAEAINGDVQKDIVQHAEVRAMRTAQRIMNTSDLTPYTLYSNCEPCPMCAFVIRELKIHRVVFALTSPHMGGYSRWHILQDKNLSRFAPVFSSPPTVRTRILEEEARQQFEAAGWTIHRSDNP